jgi:mannose-1-phosphate guanylyltransferase
VYAVILAGGGGTRLWPLSTPQRPKPFLPLLGDQSLLQQTFGRLTQGGELGLTTDDVTVVVEQRHVALVEQQLPRVRVLAEPRGRNTAAAVALATLVIERPEHEVMLVAPADHTVADGETFRSVLRTACQVVENGGLGVESALMTLGVRPTEPASDYGYLVPDLTRSIGDGLRVNVLTAFEEKPARARAVELVQQAGVAWNAGIFMWTRAAIRGALERYTALPALLAGSLAPPPRLAAAYDHITPVSIDHAVMEGAARDGRVLMAALDVGWSDLGTWSSLMAALVPGYVAQARVVPPGEAVTPAADELLLRRESGRLVLDVGAAGTISSDEPMALLPAAREYADEVGALLERVTAWETT